MWSIVIQQPIPYSQLRNKDMQLTFYVDHILPN